jgi:hypothetical protein
MLFNPLQVQAANRKAMLAAAMADNDAQPCRALRL